MLDGKDSNLKIIPTLPVARNIFKDSEPRAKRMSVLPNLYSSSPARQTKKVKRSPVKALRRNVNKMPITARQPTNSVVVHTPPRVPGMRTAPNNRFSSSLPPPMNMEYPASSPPTMDWQPTVPLAKPTRFPSSNRQHSEDVTFPVEGLNMKEVLQEMQALVKKNYLLEMENQKLNNARVSMEQRAPVERYVPPPNTPLPSPYIVPSPMPSPYIVPSPMPSQYMPSPYMPSPYMPTMRDDRSLDMSAQTSISSRSSSTIGTLTDTIQRYQYLFQVKELQEEQEAADRLKSDEEKRRMETELRKLRKHIAETNFLNNKPSL
jgi:hypothetical protein